MSGFRKKTKIVATIGPASEDKNTLLKMFKAGVNVIRVNFSHAEEEVVEKWVRTVRDLNEEHGFSVALLADLQGPKLRVGIVKEGTMVNAGDTITFTNENIEGDEKQVYMSYPQFAKDVKVGERILLDDGKLIFEVLETNLTDKVVAKVIQGGPLKSKKGVNLPNTQISLPALTEKDIKDAITAIKYEFDWIALSFVRHKEDVIDLQNLIKKHCDLKIPIIAKIEKPEAITNIEEIVHVVDGIMVARGDLGIEIPMEKVPLIQKNLVSICKTHCKPVIIATQMMESMIDGLTPTRAEVNDVANSVLDGADAVMLSGETSVGKHPVEVIENMSKIILSVEDDHRIQIPLHYPKKGSERYITDMICYNAAVMVGQVGAKAIITLTQSGYTAFQISSHRPLANIIVYTSNKRIINMLSLLWGVKAYLYEGANSTDETVVEVNNNIKQKGYIKSGDFVINLNAMPSFANSLTNTLRLTQI
ncbi:MULTISPECIES: pyruvate kinase [Apibacter]|uniref:pyruvate kinase n=1 Tax=Apibacter TaxID=1778601 RepID=UPI001C694646|nr:MULTISPECIES: pyruvate kinase [Apibacter]QYN50145.1 pyruvate kinase [Apibacter sp. ESL0404]